MSSQPSLRGRKHYSSPDFRSYGSVVAVTRGSLTKEGSDTGAAKKT